MAGTNYHSRATGQPGSDVRELARQAGPTYRGWVLSAFGAANATQVSNTAMAILINGSLQRIVASGGTANAISGTVVTNATGVFVITITDGGTLGTYKATGASIGAAVFTSLGSTILPLTMIIVAATGTAFNGGTNSLADAAYTVSLYNITGPAGLAVATEKFTVNPE